MPLQHEIVESGKRSETTQPSVDGTISRPFTLVICAFTLLAAFFYMHHYMLRGWVSHDEGTLAGTAERVLRGQLPHRDFDDVYTGGLAYLNAAAFRIFGVNLASMRYMLMMFALAWAAAMYYCISRFLAPLAAGFASLLAIVWGPANYFAALPSWYNLFFATFGTAALLRFIECRRNRWLLIAGICGGISVLFKITGAYFVIAAGAWLLAVGPDLEIAVDKIEPIVADAKLLLAWCGVGVYLVFLFRLALTKPRLPALPYLLCFFAPAAYAGVSLLVVNGFRRTVNSKYSATIAGVAIFAAGVVIPIALFLVPYLRSGALRSLTDGVFVEPIKRLDFAATLPPNTGLAWGALAAVLLLFALAARSWGFSTRISGGLAFLVALAFVIRAAQSAGAYERVWTAIFVSLPLLIILGCQRVSTSRFETTIPNYRAKLQLVILVTAMSALIHYPYSAPIYFCYVAALGVLAGAAVVASLPTFARFNFGLLASVLLIYAVWQVGPVFIHNLGWRNARYEANYLLQAPRAGGIHIPASEGQIYDRLAATIRDHARGEYIFAGPDCPEIYFLTAHRNPTATFYSFLSGNQSAQILHALTADDIDLVVVNSKPEFSPQLQPELLSRLQTQFPEHESIGPFDVRWRQ